MAANGIQVDRLLNKANETWPSGTSITMGSNWIRNGSDVVWWLYAADSHDNQILLMNTADQFIQWEGPYQDFVEQFTPATVIPQNIVANRYDAFSDASLDLGDDVDRDNDDL